MAFGRATFWQSGDHETVVRRGFWRKLSRVAAIIPFAEDLLAAY
jgi:uncharacterized membrane protein YkvA (DUF1232 family)